MEAGAGGAKACTQLGGVCIQCAGLPRVLVHAEAPGNVQERYRSIDAAAAVSCVALGISTQRPHLFGALVQYGKQLMARHTGGTAGMCGFCQ